MLIENNIAPLISIIIPCYNSADTLPRLLDSIPSVKDIEIIIVNDHSSEFLLEWENCKEKYENNRCYFYNNSGKRGAGVARNYALNRAKGKYLLFCDSDDYLIKDALKEVLDKIKEGEFSEDIIFFPPTSLNEDGTIGDRHKHYSEYVYNYIKECNVNNEMFLRCRFHVPWSKLIKREFVFKEKIFFDHVMYSNDIMFSLKTGIKAHNIKAYDLVLYCCCCKSNSLVTHKDGYAQKQREKIANNHYFYWRLHVNKQRREVFNWSFRGDWRMLKQRIRLIEYELRHGKLT